MTLHILLVKYNDRYIQGENATILAIEPCLLHYDIVYTLGKIDLARYMWGVNGSIEP